MRKVLAATAVAGALVAGIIAAGPALAQSASLSLVCSPDTNGGTLVHGVCVLPGATAGQPYEGFLLTSNGAVDTFTITSGSVPPGLFMPATYGAAGTIVGGTPAKGGTFTPVGTSTLLAWARTSKAGPDAAFIAMFERTSRFSIGPAFR